MMRQEAEVNKIFNELVSLKGIELPKGKSELRRLHVSLKEVNEEKPLNIYVGSCPDYSHKNGRYTHESLGEGVPLLTKLHLEYGLPILRTLESHKVPFSYTVMIADVEAVDEFFCQRFTQGLETEFLRCCTNSIEATTLLVEGYLKEGVLLNHGKVKFSSFFREFGRERFLRYQESYRSILHDRYEQDSTFHSRVNEDIIKRMVLYMTIYKDRINFYRLDKEDDVFLVDRTIRTMAQYLTLGRLISKVAAYPLIINHPTRNLGMFNDRNKFLLPEDGPQPQPTIPIIKLTKEVY